MPMTTAGALDGHGKTRICGQFIIPAKADVNYLTFLLTVTFLKQVIRPTKRKGVPTLILKIAIAVSIGL